MSTASGPGVSELLPTETWENLKKNPNSVLVDVRTRPEWGFVGVPDLSSLGRSVLCIEWASYPTMSANPRFVEEIEEALDGATPSEIYFICRSGARSLNAARAVSGSAIVRGGAVQCINVAEGFEGDVDQQRHRGGLNGWKARGLPWVQS